MHVLWSALSLTRHLSPSGPVRTRGRSWGRGEVRLRAGVQRARSGAQLLMSRSLLSSHRRRSRAQLHKNTADVDAEGVGGGWAGRGRVGSRTGSAALARIQSSQTYARTSATLDRFGADNAYENVERAAAAHGFTSRLLGPRRWLVAPHVSKARRAACALHASYLAPSTCGSLLVR